MTLSLFNRSSKIINLEIKDHVIRYAEVKQGERPSIHKYGEYLLPMGIMKYGKIVDYDALKIILSQCIAEWKIARRQVRFLIPNESIVMRKIQIPLDVEDNEIEGYIYLQMGTSIHLPFEEPIFDTFLLGEIDGVKEVLLFAAPEEIVNQYKLLLEDCKLKPIVADLSSLAIYRLYHAVENPNSQEHLMILEFNLFDVDVSVFVNDQPNFMRNITIHIERELWERTTNRSGGSEWGFLEDRSNYFRMLEDTFIEIERVSSFYKYNLNNGKNEVTKMLITGDHPYLDQIIHLLQQRFKMEIDIIHEEKIVADHNLKNLQSFYLPIGLGLRGGR